MNSHQKIDLEKENTEIDKDSLYDYGKFKFFKFGRGYAPNNPDKVQSNQNQDQKISSASRQPVDGELITCNTSDGIEYGFIEVDNKNEGSCKNKLNALITSLNQHFPIQGLNNFKLFAFSNEGYFDQALCKLNNTASIESRNINAALLFGESRFLSMLPELAKHVTLIILADIEPQLHAHTKHLLNCMINASSINKFIEYYKINNPISNKNGPWDIENLLEGLNGYGCKKSLGEYHFLSSEKRFNQCKNALKKLSFVNINLNLLNENECEKFSTILDTHSASLALCNFTNIHHYDESYKLKLTTELLLKKSPGCLFMYATGQDRSDDLKTNFSVNLNDYYNLTKTYSEPEININFDDDNDFELDPNALVLPRSNIDSTNLPQPKPVLMSRYKDTFISSLGNPNKLKQDNNYLLPNSEVQINNDQTLKFY